VREGEGEREREVSEGGRGVFVCLFVFYTNIIFFTENHSDSCLLDVVQKLEELHE